MCTKFEPPMVLQVLFCVPMVVLMLLISTRLFIDIKYVIEDRKISKKRDQEAHELKMKMIEKGHY